MSLSTRAIFTGATPRAIPRSGDEVTLTTSPAGGLSNPVYPEAVYAGGYTYVGYVNGSTGAISVLQYDHSDGSVATAALDTPSPVDDHNNPALHVRSDGRILALFCEHDGSTLYTALSTNAHDISAWGSVTDTGLSTTAGFTYPALVPLGSDLYLFVRDKLASLTGRLKMAKSTDDGATWSGETLVMAGATGQLPYWGFSSDGSDIHVVSTDRDPYGSQGAVTVGHMYFDGTDWLQSDGTEITATQPFAPSEMTTVYSGAAFPFMGVFDDDGYPWFTLVKDDGGSEVTGAIAKWSGSAWSLTDVYTAAYHPIDRFYGSLVLSYANRREAWAAIEGDVAEIRRYASTDDGVTWGPVDWLTADSPNDNASPIAVLDADGRMPVVWLQGTYTSMSSFSLGIKANDRG